MRISVSRQGDRANARSFFTAIVFVAAFNAAAVAQGAVTAEVPPSPIVAAELGAVKAAARLGARLSYDPLTGSGMIERSGMRASFAVGVPWILLDWSQSLRVEPPRNGPGGLVFAASAITALEEAFRAADAARKSHFSIAAILIDPGHGGKDPGAIGEHVVGGKKLRIVEKDIALDVAKRLLASLKQRFPDRKILITREGDSYPSLEERVEMANSVELASNEAIIYVSIHANAAFNKNAKGFEVWYLNPEYRRKLVEPGKPGGPEDDIAPILNAMLEEEFTTESIILARNIMNSLQTRIGAESPSRGVKAEEWFVVRNARMPSVLVEMGYITNLDEARLLSSEDYLRRVADGIYNGIVDFVGYFESMKGAPSP
jgi:N-acetylmuramoyl-L-alanine amidase